MDNEQLKQLKPGDEIFIRAEYAGIDDDGDVIFEYCWSISNGGTASRRSFVFPLNVFLRSDLQPAPKYDPCRLFKKGDRVEYSPRDGRGYFVAPWIYDEAEVIEDEDKNGFVVVRFTFNYGEPSVHNVPWYYLQLVCPVDELSPYSVRESEVIQGFDIVRDKLCVMSFPFGAKECGWYYNELAAKKAAEAECSRLNAAYRKAQK